MATFLTPSASISGIGERALVARLQQRVGPPPGYVQLGIGDDAAVMTPERGTSDVLTTDTLVEHVHFRRDWTDPRALGHKALAVNLSDLAAMGATPRAALLSLVLPSTFTVGEFDAVIDGFASLAEAHGTALIGGNLTRSPGPVVIDVTAIGSAHRRRILHRHTARRHDELYVTGWLGSAATGLALLQAGVPRADFDEDANACVARYERPAPRVRLGRIVARTGAATAAIDLSDGLADGVQRIAEASGLGAIMDAASLPIHPGAVTWASRVGQDTAQLAWRGGEDYELLFAVSPRQRRRFLAAARRCPDVHVTRIGTLVAEAGCWVTVDGHRRAMETGFSHF